jgi:hypothetical protein
VLSIAKYVVAKSCVAKYGFAKSCNVLCCKMFESVRTSCVLCSKCVKVCYKILFCKVLCCKSLQCVELQSVELQSVVQQISSF